MCSVVLNLYVYVFVFSNCIYLHFKRKGFRMRTNMPDMLMISAYIREDKYTVKFGVSIVQLKEFL